MFLTLLVVSTRTLKLKKNNFSSQVKKKGLYIISTIIY